MSPRASQQSRTPPARGSGRDRSLNTAGKTAKSFPSLQSTPQDRLHAVLEHIDEGYFSLDDQLVVTYINRAACVLLGREPNDILGRPLFDAFPEARGSIFEDNYRHALQKREELAFETWFGIAPYANWYSVRVYPDDLGISIHFTVITEQKQRAEALHASERRMSEMLDNVHLIALFLDTEGRITYCNGFLADLVGIPRDELLGKDWFETCLPANDREQVHSMFRRALETKRLVGHYTNDIQTRTGERRAVFWNNTVLTDTQGRVVGAASIGEDITEKRRAELALRQSREKYQSIVDNIGIGVALIGPDFRILEWNRRMREWYPDVDVAACPKCTVTLCRRTRADVNECPTARTFRDGDIHEQKIVMDRHGQEATYRMVASPVRDATGRVVAVIEFMEDITERLQLEEQVRQSQKMEAIGMLAGGVAHDYNNMLQTILGSVDLAHAEVKAGRDCKAELDDIRAAGERSADLTRQLLAFSRQQVLRTESLDLNDRIGGLLRMIRRVIPENITLRFNPGHHLGIVRADPAQIDQILMNLCVNARDAMPGGGAIIITTENALLDTHFCRTHSWARPGRYVLTSISDTGSGIPDDIKTRIFEPFFTTKQPGCGTGLGLATVYGIVTQHGGLIHLDSRMGEGTLFQVFLPVRENETQEEARPAAKTARGGMETILVAEDEISVRKVVSILLENAGYRVFAAADGQAALHILEEHGQDIDLALLDVVMPGLGGREIYNRIRERFPLIRVLFTTGYTAQGIHTNFLLEEGLRLVQKPFDRDTLLHAVRHTLDQPPSP